MGRTRAQPPVVDVNAFRRQHHCSREIPEIVALRLVQYSCAAEQNETYPVDQPLRSDVEADRRETIKTVLSRVVTVSRYSLKCGNPLKHLALNQGVKIAK